MPAKVKGTKVTDSSEEANLHRNLRDMKKLLSKSKTKPKAVAFQGKKRNVNRKPSAPAKRRPTVRAGGKANVPLPIPHAVSPISQPHKPSRAPETLMMFKYPWRQRPKRTRKRKGLVEEQKVRGRVGIAMRIPLFFRILAHPWTMLTWEILICTLIFASFLLTTYIDFFAFTFEFPLMHGFIIGSDIIFLLDLLIRLSVEVRRHSLALDYTVFFIPVTAKFFVLGILALTPADYIVALFITDSIQWLHYVDFLKFNRLIGLYRIQILFDLLDEGYYLDSVVAFFIQYFLKIIVFTHLVTCMFNIIGGLSVVDSLLSRNFETITDTWVGGAYRSKPAIIQNPFSDYILSMSFSVSTVTTTGYGDLVAKSEMEMVLCVVTMLIGAIGLAGHFGSQLTGFLMVDDSARHELFRRCSLIKDHLLRLGAPAIMIHKTREFYDCLWNFREGLYRVSSLRQLPTSMYEDILYDICSEMFHKALLFRDLDEPFLRAVSKAVEVLIYNPDMIVCSQGTPALAMYFIIQGECAVKHPVTARETSAILRSGCIFGETSLFCSLPYGANIETITCCQFLVIRKDKLFDIGLQHLETLNIMRARFLYRMSKLHEEYELKGIYPITWVQRKKEKRDMPVFHPEATDFRIILRWGTYFNKKVSLSDADKAFSDEPVIVDMPADDPEYSYGKFDIFGNCKVAMKLKNQKLQVWNLIVLLVTLPEMVFLGISYGFRTVARGTEFLVDTIYWVCIVVNFIYMADIIIEILTVAPATGIYYKFWDGIRIQKWNIFIYTDLLSVLPPYHIYDSTIMYVVVIIGRCLRMRKFLMYMNYLESIFPSSTFTIRLMFAIFMLCVHSVFVAAALFFIACPRLNDTDKWPCRPISWVSSYLIRGWENEGVLLKEYKRENILNENSVTASLYFAAATLTGTGYGDFVAQTLLEIFVITVFELYAFFLTGYLTAQLTSALTAFSLPAVRLEEKLLSMKSFFKLHGLTMRLRDRIIEHYKLQHEFNEAVSLPPGIKYLMYDTPPYLSEEALYAELSVTLEGVPCFTNADPKMLIAMSKVMDYYVLPPDITFVRRGDVRRQLYIVSRGSVAVLKEDTVEVKEILTETGHFGLRDLLFGEPSFNNIKTLSYCFIYSIDLRTFSMIVGGDEDLQKAIEVQREELKARIKSLNLIYLTATLDWEKKERKPTQIASWITFPKCHEDSSTISTYEEYLEGFKGKVLGKILKCILMPRTVHPAGTFALIWCLVTAVAGLLTFLVAVLEFLPQFMSPHLSHVLLVFKLVFMTDIYVRLHWGFYTESNHLVYHPYLTATHYLLEGPFLFGFLCELLEQSQALWFLGAADWTERGEGFRWAICLQLHRAAHLLRLPIVIQFGHQVTGFRTAILCVIYSVLTLAVSSFVASVAIYLACPWDWTVWADSMVTKVPACYINTWVDAKDVLRSEMTNGFKRWVVAVYYVSQPIFGVGYGDLQTLKKGEMILSICLMIVGYVATRCVISDMTAYTVSGDAVRSEYIERTKRINAVMKKQGVDRRLITRVNMHLQHTWLLSRGLQPEELFKDLHPALQGDFFREYIGETVAKVPILAGQSDNILRTLCTHLKRIYFVRGDCIARMGNLEFEMYIIVDGMVWVTGGSKSEVLCHLGPGETFGETQMLHGSFRKYSAIASCNVEVFSLNAGSFADILEHYPALREDMDLRMNNTKMDLYERKIHFNRVRQRRAGRFMAERASARISSTVQKVDAFENNSLFQIDQEGVAQTLWWRVRNGFSARVLSWGPDDGNLPFIYLATKVTANRPNLLVHPRCGFQRHFSVVIIFVSWLSPALAIYLQAIATGDRNMVPLFLQLNQAMDDIYIIHIILQIFTPFVTVEGKYCKENGKVACRYLSSLSRFGFDAASSFPFHLLADYGGGHYSFLELLKLLRLVHYFRTLREGLENITVTTYRYNLVVSVTSFALMAHVLSCLFYAISACKHENSSCVYREGTWTYEYINSPHTFGGQAGPDDILPWKWYIRSLFWIVTTVSTTGFGEITPNSLVEVIFALFCMFCGAFLLAIILSQFTQGLASLNQYRNDYLYQLKIDSRYLRSLGLSKYRQACFQDWFLHRWLASRGSSFRQAVEILPLSFRHYVNLALYHKTLSKVVLFEGFDRRFFLAIASLVDHTVYLEGQTIGFEGDMGNHLFIVVSGRVSGYHLNRNKEPKLIRWYDEGCIFARFPTLFYNQGFTKTYRAEVITEVLTITKQSIFYLSRLFPEFAARLQAYSKATFDPEFGSSSIFAGDFEDDVLSMKDYMEEMMEIQGNSFIDDEARTSVGSDKHAVLLRKGLRHRRYRPRKWKKRRRKKVAEKLNVGAIREALARSIYEHQVREGGKQIAKMQTRYNNTGTTPTNSTTGQGRKTPRKK